MSESRLQSVKRIEELNNRFAEKLIEKGIALSQEETYTSLIDKMANETGNKTDKQLTSLLNGSITEFTFPEELTYLREGAFYACKNLKSIYVPDTITDTSVRVFANCSNLETIRIPPVSTLKSYFCAQCTSLKNVTLEEGTRQLSSSAFQGCTALEAITLHGEVRTLGTSLFQGCTSLKTINIPSKIYTIGTNTFKDCTALEFVTIENGFYKSGLNLSASTLYSVDTIVGWFNALKDRNNTTAATLTIGATNIAKLTEEQIAIATNKNWTIA